MDRRDRGRSSRAAQRSGFRLLLSIAAIDSISRAGFMVFVPFLLIGKGASIATAGFMVTLIFVGGGLGYGLYQAAGLAVPLTFAKFSRGFEGEADYLGMQYMYATGYDPSASISFFEKIQAKEKKKPGTLAKAFASHPQTPDRISELQKEMATILPTKDQYLISSSEFDDVKARLAALENRRKLNDAKTKQEPRSNRHLRETAVPDPASVNEGELL